jgi:hypothetical protein
MARKLLFVLTLLTLSFMTVQAQYPLITVQTLQNVSSGNLGNCQDSSAYAGDTVRIHAVVVTDPDSASFTTATRGQLWVRAGYGPFSGLDVIQFFDPNQNGLATLEVGDSVELTGTVVEYFHETELELLSGTQITILNAGATIQPSVVSVGDLNDASQVNQVQTGEQWEGQYVEVQNVTVVSVDPFSGGTRVSFVVQDQSGNRLNVTDKFRVQRLPNGNPAGTFVSPNVGDTYTYIRGVLTHSTNGCFGTNGRGYEMSPTKKSDYGLASAAPSIITVSRNLVTPSSTQAVTVTANISDITQSVSSATLYYAVGEANTTYTNVAMTLASGTNQSGTWTANIPAQSNGAFVKYYVCATDNNNNTSCNRSVPNGADPFFFTVRDNGTTIYDVQYVPNSFANSNSGYDDMTVTVEGVVTASAEATNLGFVFIQQENELAWAGIMLTDNPSLATLTVGQKVRVTGTVNESFNFTRVEQISSIQSIGTGTITPLGLNPANFTSYDRLLNEPYEGMLVELRNPTPGACVYVVDNNADDPSNFAEYRIGSDLFDPVTGCRVLAGRVTNSAYSSLNFSYVNDAQWATTDGIMNVTPIVVQNGDVFASMEGIIAYTFGNMKLLPRNNSDANFSSGCGVSVEDAAQGRVTLYPNPAQSSFNIRYHFEGTSTEGTAMVCDLAGRVLKTVSLSGIEGEQIVEVQDLAAGSYLLKVVNVDGKTVDVLRLSLMR